MVDPPVRAIGVGEHVTCALLEVGEVRCWGALHLAATSQSSTPISIGLTDVVSLGVGTRHVCVARGDGSVWCWGRNSDGQLGDGTTTDLAVPTQVTGVTGIVEVVAGGAHTCARDRDGAVWCWGHPDCVGHGESTPTRRPGRVAPLPAASRLVAGDDVTCALLADDRPRCWGFNTTGLFNRRLGPVLRPIASPALAGAMTLALGSAHACVAQEDGVVYCMGDDQFGQLGDQRVPDDAICDKHTPDGVRCKWTDPYSVPTSDPEAPTRPPDVPLAQPVVIEKSFPERQGLVLAAADRTVALAAGYGRTCSITQSGAVQCWGQQYHSGNEWAHRTPHTIAGTEGAVAVAVAHEHACALMKDRSVRCWGYNRSGELGTGEWTENLVASPTATAVRW
ncbi:hypothetical protein [Nannocystis sp. SCPEA4]|uniref:RCC1 domain-containing protein n=1 Tax=Nannocystis sp. SCPEA4 TaxID=2996787 RepID=UPI00226DC763|nr:hypothetical protein [Nannocystis sp. SCPEA4]